jgi:uncharacterized protein (TIGR03066 family)
MRRWLALPVLGLLVMFAASSAHADSKPDPKKALVGKWRSDEVKDVTIEFTAKGDMHFVYTDPKGGKGVNYDGTYKWIDATTLETTMFGSEEPKPERSTVAIDGDKLSVTNPKGKVEKFTRVK